MPGTNIIAVTGGRAYRDRRHVYKVMMRLDYEERIDILLEGGAGWIDRKGWYGADFIASRWAKEMGRTSITVYADWQTHGKFAGPIRNREMLATWKPQKLIAFPGGAGTQSCVDFAEELGIPVIVV